MKRAYCFLVSIIWFSLNCHAQYFERIFNFSDSAYIDHGVWDGRFSENNEFRVFISALKAESNAVNIILATLNHQNEIVNTSTLGDSGQFLYSTRQASLHPISSTVDVIRYGEIIPPDQRTEWSRLAHLATYDGSTITYERAIRKDGYIFCVPFDLVAIDSNFVMLCYGVLDTLVPNPHGNDTTIDLTRAFLWEQSFHGKSGREYMLLESTISSNTTFSAWKIDTDSLKNIYVGGYLYGGDLGWYKQPAIKKFDRDLNLIWQRQYANEFVFWGAESKKEFDMQVMLNGEVFILANNTHRYGNHTIADGVDSNKVFLAKIGTDGNQRWSREFNAKTVTKFEHTKDSRPMNLQVAANGNILVSLHGDEPEIMLLNSFGNIIWHRVLNTPSFMRLQGAFLNDMGEIVVMGEVEFGDGDSLPKGTYAYLAWLDNYGCLTPDCNLADSLHIGVPRVQYLSETFAFKIFPNPVVNQLQITLPNEQEFAANTLLEIYDLNGKLITTYNQPNFPTSISMENFSSGKYLLVIKNETRLLHTEILIKQ